MVREAGEGRSRGVLKNGSVQVASAGVGGTSPWRRKRQPVASQRLLLWGRRKAEQRPSHKTCLDEPHQARMGHSHRPLQHTPLTRGPAWILPASGKPPPRISVLLVHVSVMRTHKLHPDSVSPCRQEHVNDKDCKPSTVSIPGLSQSTYLIFLLQRFSLEQSSRLCQQGEVDAIRVDSLPK